ncbi:MAG: histidine phosphatase family protein [Acidimicrobiia bacterium]|jgi:broad specificity phosphatase PhoE
MAKQLELRRHTDNDGDVLTAAGVEAAVEIGRGLSGGYRFIATSNARRAVQTAGCLLAGLGETVPGGVIFSPGLRSSREEEWRAAYSKMGKGDLGSLREADPDLVSEDSATLAGGLRRLFARLDDGEKALAIGHSPTLEAAVLGLTSRVVEPLGKGAGVLLTAEAKEFGVKERLGT